MSLAVDPPGKSSIQNLRQGSVDAIADDDHPGIALVRVRVGNQLQRQQLELATADGKIAMQQSLVEEL